ncbi:glycosyltransferase family 2 protein [Bifidobacterium sp. SO1]|uniref:glycosyltransferase family 2 protein n=1 Tax=Bifidobacterium sp. SO1 TaxID=2809029 RepID=UPI001BDCE396|nr:glycosyltransferase family 2 protein [Bifidobacterium sp. SO1]MBT1162421.1 glycosyltransferase family 2 protein [Bifidobacterium sp. SO1]
MNPTGSNELQQTISTLLARRPYTHRQDVNPAIAAVITVERDLRFFPDTMKAVLRQSMLPAVIVVADCTGRSEPVVARFEVIPSSAGPLRAVPESKSVEIRVVPVKGATSFGDAATKGMTAAGLPATVRAWWMLHDDSRPADDTCLASLADAWRNNPTTSLLGAKQLDWQANDLHDVGLYASRHRLESLVVDGEEDQEQYDNRQDVFAVSLAGALLPVRTLHEVEGVNRWFTTYGESADFCRRICLDGGRVVVVPAARIAHRRARYEGVRTRGGEAVADGERLHSTMAVISAGQRYRYTDIRMLWWPLLWLWLLLRAFAVSLMQLLSKQPYRAGCELCLPGRALISLPGAIRARRLVARHSNVPMTRLSALSVNRQQMNQWKDRAQALEDQHNTVLLSPLARAHLRRRRIRRWGLASCMMLIALLAVVIPYHTVIVGAFVSGTSLYSAQLLPTSASFSQLAQAATTPWVFGTGTGIPAPPAPWLLVWLAASVVTIGHPAAALTMIFLLAAPLAAISFWALAGIFTRSNGVRVAGGLLWVALALAAGLFDTADLPMLTVMVFMPAAFAFAFRAVGMYRTEDQLHPHRSMQSSALASLCFIPVVASQPQLLLPLIASFLVFVLFVRRHRVMLLLMPVPAAFVVSPTLVNAIKYSSEGMWRQLFGSVTVPRLNIEGGPRSATMIDVVMRVFALDGIGTLRAIAMFLVLAVIVALAVLSLALPFALRASRLMWVTGLTGAALALCCTRIVVASDTGADVAASPVPGFMMMMLGLLSCVCLVAGAAVKRFVPLRTVVQSADGTSKSDGAPVVGRTSAFVRIGRVLLIMGLTVCVAVTGWVGLSVTDRRSVAVSDSGLPMVAVDYLAQGEDHRVLAIHATSNNDVAFTVMRSERGDLIDSSPVRRIRLAFSTTDETSQRADAVLSRSVARLLAGADAQSIRDISTLGFGGIFVAVDPADDTDSAAQRLVSNVTASDGTQSVVAAANGTYYRLTINSADQQNIDTSWQQRTQSSYWRYAWLACMGVVIVLYCLVALPHRTYRYAGEES